MAGAPFTSYWKDLILQRGASVKSYGAVGDNTTNNAAAITAAITAISAGGTLTIPAGNFKVNSTITINKAITIRFEGGNITTAGNIPIFTFAANGIVLDKPVLIGSGKADVGTKPLQTGILIDGYTNFVINSPIIDAMAGTGIYFANTYNSSVRNPGKITSPLITNCTTGIQSGVRGEYTDIASPNISQCTTGLRIMGGNVNISGGCIFDNTTGVHLESGTNHGHGSISGCLINHNTTAVYADTVTLGFGFIGCHIIDGLVHLKDSNNIIFQASPQLAVSWRFEGGENNHIRHNCIRKLAGYTLENNYNSNQSHVEWHDNFPYPGDTKFTQVEQMKGGWFIGQEAAQTVATGVSAQVINYSATTQATSNNLTQTKYVFYDATNKNILSPNLSNNTLKRVKMLLKFTLPNTGDINKIFFALQTVDVVRTLAYLNIIPTANDGTTTSYLVTFEGFVGVGANEKIKVICTNQSGQTVTIAGSSTERTLQIEGL